MEFPSNQQHNLNIDMIQWDKDNQCLALLSVSVSDSPRQQRASRSGV